MEDGGKDLGKAPTIEWFLLLSLFYSSAPQGYPDWGLTAHYPTPAALSLQVQDY